MSAKAAIMPAPGLAEARRLMQSNPLAAISLAMGCMSGETEREARALHIDALNCCGEYDGARKLYVPLQIQSPGELIVQACPAEAEILKAARHTRAIMINEDHQRPETRTLSLLLLAPLRALGYTHFAVEALSVDDRDLAQRRFPTWSSGYYTREPLFGVMLREAIRLGFKLVAYDHGYSPVDAEDREQSQAIHIAEILNGDGANRVLVHAGFAHVFRDPRFLGGRAPMAARLKTMTNTRPLTVDQTLSWAESQELNSRGFEPGNYLVGDGIALNDDKNVDVTIANASGSARSAGGWLESLPDRVPHFIEPEVGEGEYPIHFAAGLEDEPSDAIPVDAMIMWDASDRKRLFLIRGKKHVIRSTDAMGHERSSYSMSA